MQKNNPFFFVIGTHCCGKSSIIKRLANEGHIGFAGSEIGKDLYYQESFSTAEQDENFEFRIADLELTRDTGIAIANSIAVSETWHPGNLAYALTRNPHCADELIALYNKSPLKNNAVGIWLTLSEPQSIISKRTKTFSDNVAWACEFYTQIQNNIEESLRLMGLRESVYIVSADSDQETVYQQVLSIVLNASEAKEEIPEIKI